MRALRWIVSHALAFGLGWLAGHAAAEREAPPANPHGLAWLDRLDWTRRSLVGGGSDGA